MPSKKGLSEHLVEDSSYPTVKLKKLLWAAGLLQKICSSCGLGPDWNGAPLTLQIDHINGVNHDHRLENLRILCPNCHSQTATYAGRNRAPVALTRPCENCGTMKRRKGAKRCRKCAAQERYQAPYPPDEELQALLDTTSLVALAERWGRTPQAIGRYLKRRGVQ